MKLIIMTSNDLRKQSFRDFGPFKLNEFRNNFKNKNILGARGVYAFVVKKKFRRLIGETDILYIGHAAGHTAPIYSRMADYCRGSKSAPQDERIHNVLKKIGKKLEIFLLYKILANKKESRDKERKLLEKFTKEHLESPPLNRSI